MFLLRFRRKKEKEILVVKDIDGVLYISVGILGKQKDSVKNMKHYILTKHQEVKLLKLLKARNCGRDMKTLCRQ